MLYHKPVSLVFVIPPILHTLISVSLSMLCNLSNQQSCLIEHCCLFPSLCTYQSSVWYVAYATISSAFRCAIYIYTA